MHTNLDPQELSKFSQGDWWDEHHGAYAMLHQLNPIRLKFIMDQTSLQNKHVVDLGCGGGILMEALAEAGAIVTGVDLNETALTQARQHAELKQLNIDYQLENIETFSQNHTGKFDLVTCMEMLEHVPDPESIIASAARLLKPGGMAFFSTINRSPLAYLEAVVAAEYVLKLLPQGTHDYQKFIKPSELCDAARKHQLELIALNGLNYHPIHKSFTLSEKPRTNYLVAFLRGVCAPN